MAGCARTAASIARCWAAADGWLRTAGCRPCGPALLGLTWVIGLQAGRYTWMGSAFARDRPLATRVSEVLRPTAKVTAVAPSTMAVSVTAVRAGRANGAARPMVTGLGSGSLLSARCAA